MTSATAPSTVTPASGVLVPRSHIPDVLVVGGGIVGLACAWYATRAGARVTVLDPSPGDGATHAAAGMLAPVGEAEPDDAAATALHLAGAALWPGFAAELRASSGRDPGFEATGALLLAYDAGDRADLLRRLDQHAATGLRSVALTVADARREEPGLGPVAGAALAPDDHRADPRATHRALLEAARAAHVRRVPTSAARLVREGARVVGAVDDAGHVHLAGLTVLAAGTPSRTLAADAGAPAVPVRDVVGQTLRLAAGPDLPLARTIRGQVQGRAVYVVPRAPRPDGTREIVVGATSEETADARRPRTGGTFALLRDARALVPGLDETTLAEVTQRARPTTPDGRPLVGPSGLPGLWLATGHGRNGVLLAPFTGVALVQALGAATPGLPGDSLDRALAATDPARLTAPDHRRTA
ncbi:glycine oxidase ThiO [Luteimicrobium xylanilyticum]|uniref:D-amino acid dehydrogenase (Quinone) n=1 Tax=Luteimicrobium xylanilyticum TaxID=1133546 RepID=A0A5P9Q7J0_9MICO|nr:FAD-dependent oxidoreductase [Luteimicrobium xylanilyticum]QFU97403.1 D-amino acid dehydrogenase (quinone) [Luteimicrobium xylanilyticum]